MTLYVQEPAIESTTLADAAGVNRATVSAAGALKMDGSAVTQPISAVSLPLPTGASTSANQTTGNASLASVDAKLVPANRVLLDAGKVFGFAIEQNQASTGEQSFILLRNPSGSGKTLYLGRIAVGAIDNLTRFRLRVYQKPTVTSVGTAGTIYSNQVKTSPPTSIALVYTLPTISANGTRIRSYSQADTGMRDESLVFSISVAAGQDLLITGDTDASNKILFANMTWSEE